MLNANIHMFIPAMKVGIDVVLLTFIYGFGPPSIAPILRRFLLVLKQVGFNLFLLPLFLIFLFLFLRP